MDQQQYDEISLKELITVLWSERRLIIIITLATTILAGIYSFILAKPVYEATSELIIQLPEDIPTRYGSYKLPSDNPNDYINFIKSNEVIKYVIKKESLDTTVQSFQKKIQVEQDKEANRFLVTISAGGAEKAASVNDALVESFIMLQSINYKKYALDEFISNYERGIDTSQINIESKERLLTERKKLLDGIKPIYTLQKSLFNDPETAAAYADKFNLNLSELSQSMLVEENARDIYLKLEEVYVNTESELIDLKEAQYNRNERLKELKDEQQLLTDSLSSGKLNEILNGKVDVFENKILVVSPALTPTNPVAPRKALNLAIGVVLGLMLGVFVAFFANYWKNS